MKMLESVDENVRINITKQKMKAVGS